MTKVISHLQHTTKEIRLISASAWGLVGSDHPKVQKQQQMQFKEAPIGKVHLVQDNVMIHDRDGALPFDYATTENVDEITCGLCRNILRARSSKH